MGRCKSPSFPAFFPINSLTHRWNMHKSNINWIFRLTFWSLGLNEKTLTKAQRTRGLSSYHKITVHSSKILNILQFPNTDQALKLKSQPDISISTKSKVKIFTKPTFRILTKIQLRNLNYKHQQQNTDQTSASKSRLNFNFKILIKVLKVWTKVKIYDQTSASKSATNCCQHNPHHQHQQQ